MISNTELLYVKAKQFQDKRVKIVEDYEKAFQALERFKGSQGYEDDVKSLQEKRDGELTALIKEYRPGFHTVFGGMMDAIGRRTVSAPTTDQVNLLNILKLKKKVTLEECQRIAESVKDNPIAVSVVTEIAHDHGILQGFDHLCPEMSSQRASKIVTELKNTVEDFLQYDTTRASRLAKQYYEDRYGSADRQLTKRRLFTDKEDFYREEVGLDRESFKQFSKIVDA